MCPVFRAPAISRIRPAKFSDIPIWTIAARTLIVGCLDVSKIGFADGLADNSGGFGVVEIALPLQLLRLFALERQPQEGVGRCCSYVAGGDHGEFQIRTDRSDHIAEHANGTHLRQRVFHEVAGAQVEHVRTVDLVELLFEVVEAGYGAGSAGFIGSETAERNNMFDARVLNCRRDRVADAVLDKHGRRCW